ncbi:hypothetical protein N4R57_05825 [Rhodobacteraceae bacterium D3-12]|nr:hypothetical protein N4R57_05825 [Rhodobacteraceae bacterium D3-12]
MSIRSLKSIAIVAGVSLSLSVGAAFANSKSTTSSNAATSQTKPVKDGFATAGGLGSTRVTDKKKGD